MESSRASGRRSPQAGQYALAVPAAQLGHVQTPPTIIDQAAAAATASTRVLARPATASNRRLASMPIGRLLVRVRERVDARLAEPRTRDLHADRQPRARES